MSQRLRAIYHGGAFLPNGPCDVPEDLEVEFIVHGPFVLPQHVRDLEEQRRILKTVVERMQKNSIPSGAPRLTREALHERR